MGIRPLFIKTLPCRGHRPSFFAHFDFFGGSDISKDDIFELPFSISLLLILGVGGTSSIFVKPLLDRRTFCTSFGKVDLLGVNAVATFLADLRIVFLTSHDRFLARYQRIDDTTVQMSAIAPAAQLVRPRTSEHHNADDDDDDGNDPSPRYGERSRIRPSGSCITVSRA